MVGREIPGDRSLPEKWMGDLIHLQTHEHISKATPGDRVTPDFMDGSSFSGHQVRAF